MTTTPVEPRTPEAETIQTIKRRGLFAVAWAAVAGLVLKQTTQPVEASTAALIANSETAGVSNTVVGPSTIVGASGTSYSSAAAVIIGDSSNVVLPGAAAGVHGTAGSPVPAPVVCGVYGQGGTFTGVLGTAGSSGQAAVYGIGTGAAYGVRGESTSGNGVRGEIPSTSSQNGIAVYGLNYSTFAGSGPGAGGFGLYGLSAKGHGLVGAIATAGAAAVVGATNGVAGGYAGAFYGPVAVSGNFTVVSGAKSAAVPHPDGSHRRLYCMESPESWFEDFGTGRLECGDAEIRIDPDFGAVVNLTDYQVFLTQYDQHNDLCVTDRTATGFRVRAKDPGADGQFGWRIVAKRKDITGNRLETVTVPPEPTLPPLEPEMTPPTPDRRLRR